MINFNNMETACSTRCRKCPCDNCSTDAPLYAVRLMGDLTPNDFLLCIKCLQRFYDNKLLREQNGQTENM